MSCLPEEEGDGQVSWTIWLDLWAQSARHPEVAAVRREFDEHWRRTIADVVIEGQRDGEFAAINADDFAVTFSSLLDGFAIQTALSDPVVSTSARSGSAWSSLPSQLGFAWSQKRLARRQRVAPVARDHPSQRAGSLTVPGGQIDLMSLTKTLHRDRRGRLRSTSTSPAGSSSRCSARPAVARPRRCG